MGIDYANSGVGVTCFSSSDVGVAIGSWSSDDSPDGVVDHACLKYDSHA